MRKYNRDKVLFFFVSIFMGIASIYFNNVIAALVAVFCSYHAVKSDNYFGKLETNRIVNSKREISNSRLVLAVSLVFYSLIFCLITLYLSTFDSFYAISIITWFISIFLILLSGLYFDQFNLKDFLRKLREINFNENRETIIEVIILTIITLVAFYLRVVYLNIVPVAVHGDEGEMGMEALRVLGIGEPLAPFRTGWGPHPNLFYYMQAITIKIFGRNEIGLRMLSPFFGAGCVPLVFYLGKLIWGKLAGYSAAWLLTVSHFHIQYSRLGLNNIESAFLMIGFILLIIIVLKKGNNETLLSDEEKFSNHNLFTNKNLFTFILIGLTIGLAQYFYVGSRLIFLIAVPIFFLLYYQKRIRIVQLIIMALSIFIIISPLGYFYLKNPDKFITRIDTVSVFNSEYIKSKFGENITASNGFLRIVLSQSQKNLAFFLKDGDISDFYYASVPSFDFLTTLLFWLGLGLLIVRLKKIPELVIFIWFSFGIIFGGIVTNNPPYGARLLMMTPTVYIIAGVYIQFVWKYLEELYKKIPNNKISLFSITSPLIVIILVITLLINYNIYFNLYPAANINILSIKVTQDIIKEEPTNHIYLFGEGNLYVNHGTIRFLAGVGKATDIKQLEEIPAKQKDGKGIIVIATPSKFEEFKEIENLYPEGEMFNMFVGNKLVFMKYRIPNG